MATLAPVLTPERSKVEIRKLAEFRGLRVLAWNGNVLYAAHGYRLLKALVAGDGFVFDPVAVYRPEWWRRISSQSRLAYRLVRDGFHALAVHPAGNLIAAVPGEIVTLRPGETEFKTTYRVPRGTRPLHLTVTPGGGAYWGEYFDNAERDQVHIYGSDDGGCHWNVAYTFGEGAIRHVHNIVYDRWDHCLWVLTGDYGNECKVLRASLDFATIDEVIAGDQQSRGVAVIVDETGLFYASDTPLEQNHIYHLDRGGRRRECSPIPGSSIYGCRTLSGMFFSTMVEPSDFNPSREVTLFGSLGGGDWDSLAGWRKDPWPMKYFQYGNAFLPDGENSTDLLAATTIAVEGADLRTSIWQTFSLQGVQGTTGANRAEQFPVL
jgi:hypothetical protein